MTARPASHRPPHPPMAQAPAEPAGQGMPRALVGLHVSACELGRIMPMHTILTPEGHVLSAGPTLLRLFPGETILGKSFFGLFELRAPVWITDMAGLTSRCFHKLRLSPRGPGAGLRMRGIAVPLDDGKGLLVNLSFGIDVMRAVRKMQLTDMDFAPTDLAMELLYAVEANAAVRGEMRELSRRLVGARLQAQEEAQTDPLTGLKNRRACDSFLSRLCREGASFSLMQIDLDYFKQVNDRLGHAAGDHVLRHVAGVLQSQARVQDCLARLGGDEFTVILPSLTDPARLLAMGERMIDLVNRPIPFQDDHCDVSASIGFAIVPEGLRLDPNEVLGEADTMLYAAKGAGRGRVMGTRLGEPAEPIEPAAPPPTG